MASGNFNADLTATPPLSVAQFYSGLTPPPGSIGVCLSGGGSRALTAGMGQLQALAHLTFNGASMLGQVKALSTVSGGSWLGVPYEFLPSNGPSDSAFLGVYNSNIGSETLTLLGQLSAQSAAAPITNTVFSPLLLAVQAVILYELNVPPNMIWQTIVGLNILFPPGLFQPNLSLAPTDLFSWMILHRQRTRVRCRGRSLGSGANRRRAQAGSSKGNKRRAKGSRHSGATSSRSFRKSRR